MKKFLYEHSLSIALGIGFLVTSILAYPLTPEDGNYWYDWMLMMAGSFGGGLIIVVLGVKFWQKNSDPTKPPGT